MSTRVCENCEDAPVSVYCQECKQEFCSHCDEDFHRPAKMASHVRKARFPTQIADILVKCEKEGKATDYGANKPEGKNIFKYVLEYDEGYYYLFKNDSKDAHFDTELEFKLNNLEIVGFEGASRVKVSLPPSSLQYVHLHRVNQQLNCTCEIVQRFAIVPPKPGKKPQVFVPVTYTADSPVDQLMKQTEIEGVCSDHGAQDKNGEFIFQYQWEFSGGYCFLWQNCSKDVRFHKELELTLNNLQIKGKEPGTNKWVVDLAPGGTDFMILQEIEAKKAYGVAVRAGFTLSKIKA